MGFMLFPFLGSLWVHSKINVKYILYVYFDLNGDVAEWLRRWPAKPLGIARVGSNPIVIVHLSLFLFLSF